LKSFKLAPAFKSIVTIKDVAVRAKLAVATVSYALRNDPRIAEETRRQVHEVAQALGYRPNPRVASLMAHIRRAHSRAPGERIAFVWVHTDQAQAARDPFMRKVFLGAKRRAELAGFALEEFWPSEPGMNDRRLQSIIRARGIVGVLLSPVVTHDATLALDWDWQYFSPAAIGAVAWQPELNHAAHHHYRGMETTLLELSMLGCKRPAALLDAGANLRAHLTWEAAFLAHHPVRSRARSLLRLDDMDEDGATAWVNETKPDALIVTIPDRINTSGLRSVCRRHGIPVAALSWNPGYPGVGGVDQCYDRIAEFAVDLVVTQLNNNETGVPDLPRIMLVPGRWVAPNLAAPAS
jgi:LacI family transcriptional regulator